jgi:uncharacterized coiled-coil DUF342 family protein
MSDCEFCARGRTREFDDTHRKFREKGEVLDEMSESLESLNFNDLIKAAKDAQNGVVQEYEDQKSSWETQLNKLNSSADEIRSKIRIAEGKLSSVKQSIARIEEIFPESKFKLQTVTKELELQSKANTEQADELQVCKELAEKMKIWGKVEVGKVLTFTQQVTS